MNRNKAKTFRSIAALLSLIMVFIMAAPLSFAEGEDVSAGSRSSDDHKGNASWEFSAFGVNTSSSNSGYEIDPDNGGVRVFSNNSSGKMVPWATDGLYINDCF